MGDFDCTKDEFLRDFYIPTYILVPLSPKKEVPYVPSCPVLVFINTKSGGQLGSELIVTYRKILNQFQVFDLGDESPEKVLHKIYSNLEKLKSESDYLADEIQKRLRLLVAGGDGTINWLLGVVSDLKLAYPPPVATVPLGTGNNIHFSFGWGKKNPGTDYYSVNFFLEQVKQAREVKIDSWHVVMRMGRSHDGSCDPVAPLELPHSLHAFRRVAHSDSPELDDNQTFRGGFWNYFSIGMDAQVSYAFHSERKLHPEKFKNQLANQITYLKLGCTQGWFCTSFFHHTSRNIGHLVKVKVMKTAGQWEKLHIPHSIRSIVCLNLPSYSGGLNPWGTPSNKKKQDRELTPPFVDDGLLEIVGFRDAWHGLVLLTPKGHGTRLAQAHKIQFKFHKAAADQTYMRLDGEPWKQPLPKHDGKVVVEISHLGQVKMLATDKCIAKGITDASTPSTALYQNDESKSEDNDDSSSKEGRKFGAAETFRYSDSDSDPHVRVV